MAREIKRLFGRWPKGLSCGIFYRLSSELLFLGYAAVDLLVSVKEIR